MILTKKILDSTGKENSVCVYIHERHLDKVILKIEINGKYNPDIYIINYDGTRGYNSLQDKTEEVSLRDKIEEAIASHNDFPFFD